MTAGRVASLAALCGALLLLGGCWGIAPIEKAGLVSLLAIDAAPGGGYVVTADLLSPSGVPAPSPSGGGGTAGTPVHIRHATAPTVFQAIRGLSAVSHRDVEFSHLQGVIVAEGVARDGLAGPIDSLTRSPEVSVVAPWLLVAREATAAGLLEQAGSATPYPGQVLSDTANWSRQRTPYVAMRVWQFVKQMGLAADEPATAGVIVDTSQGTGKRAAFRLTGVALFRGGRLVGWLEGDAALGWAVATGRIQEQAVVVPGPSGGSFTVELHHIQRRLHVRQGPHGPTVEMDLNVTTQLSAAHGAPADFWKDPGLERLVESATEAVLTADVRDALRQAQAVGADVFSLGEYVRVQDFRDWSGLRPGWSTSGFPALAVTPKVHVHLVDVGLVVCPLVGGC